MLRDGRHVRVRPLRPSDQSDWRALWSGYLDFYGAVVEEPVRQATWTRLLDAERRDMTGLIALATPAASADDAKLGGDALGLAHLIFHPHCWRAGEVCYLQDLFVAPAARTLGAGAALIAAVYAEADRRGAEDVYWMTQTTNAAARRLYDRVGRPTEFMKYVRV